MAKKLKRQPYEVWIEEDSKGNEHLKAYVPSKRGYATINIYRWRDLTQDVLLFLLDNSNQSAERRARLDAEYIVFREHENARKNTANAQISDGEDETPNGTYRVVLSTESTEESHLRAEDKAKLHQLLRQRLNPRHAVWVYLFYGRCMKAIDIARSELPEGSQKEIETLANTISRAVKRGMEKLRREFPQGLSGFDQF